MKRIILTVLIITNIATCASAQKNSDSTNCNRSIKFEEWKKNLPKEVCIPHGYRILFPHNQYPTDINGDGLKDYVFKWGKAKLQDGDTLFVSIYTQNADSTFSFFTSLYNLYPIYFKSDIYEQVTDEKLKKIFSIYYRRYPLKELIFNNDKIIISFWTEAVAGLILTYQFDKEKSDWFLIKQEEWVELEKTKITDLGAPDPNQSIKDFDYLNWIQQ
ncbi:MAG: hypothetical protein LBQ31_07775 [Bacteroidales bacterium]|jgi:hypothetical protein|nr:hypothetical protein [Bacteroidales bacterium]